MMPRLSLRGTTLRRLEIAAIFLPLAFLGLYYYLMLGPLHGFFHMWLGFVALWAGLTVPIWLFTRAVFGVFRAMQAEITALHAETQRLNDGLLALHRVNTTLSRETGYDRAVQRVVESARDLFGAPFALLALPEGLRGTPAIVVSDGAREPVTHQVSAALIREVTEACATGALCSSPSGSAGLLPGWLLQGSVVCASIPSAGTTAGTLLVGRPGRGSFDGIDARVHAMFATHAAIVLRNARLYEDVQALAVERERQQIAREMHDGLAQVLGFVNTKAQAVEQFLQKGNTELARAQMAELAEAARRVYADIREGIVALRTQRGADGRELDELVAEYVEEFEHFAHMRVVVEWKVSPQSLALSPVAEVQLLRIVQEALTNVRRHARASSVEIIFQEVDGALVVQIRDDGRGFDPGRVARGEWPQFGLRAMAERAEAAGGSLSIESKPGHGTVVTATFPGTVHGEEADADRPSR
ncbi:MAG: hypothetical protein Kow0010_00840 [Dehalococcoidia bacterium]